MFTSKLTTLGRGITSRIVLTTDPPAPAEFPALNSDDPCASTRRKAVCLTGVLLGAALAALAQGTDPLPISHPVMHLTAEEKQLVEASFNRAPQYSGPPSFDRSPGGSLSLLSRLPYIPAQRNQGSCGDCWQWAGTGVMEVAHDVQDGVHDRLSVQYLNSCEYAAIGKTCCSGGWLSDVATFYSATGYNQAIPWANPGATWQDGDASCDTSCGGVATSPAYPISHIAVVSIATRGVGQVQAIANIKSVLSQNKAVWFAFFMGQGSDWSDFDTFWNSQPESVVWTNFYCGQAYGSGGAGHAVLCVGYNDDDPNNSYWIIVNSWGTTAGRPNGIFRVAMNLDYDCSDSGGGQDLYWQTLDMQYTAPNSPIITSQPANQTVSVGGTATFSVGASGSAPLSYFWKRGGSFIAGATASTYSTNNMQLPDSGAQFSCVVSNSYGSILSSNAILTVTSTLVQNGGFEAGNFTNWGGSQSGASVTSSSIYVHSGTYGARLGPVGSLGYLTQTIPTVPGSSYRISLWLNNTNGSSPNEFQVSWGGAILYDGVNLGALAWTNLQLTATATNASTVLQLGFRQDPSYLGLDDVSVTPQFNDFCSTAILIPSATYTNSQSTTNATSTGDPTPTCVGGFGKGVWYSYTALASGQLVVDTIGSGFDTGLALYTGSCGSLSQVACDDDSGGNLTSKITISATGGVTYYILAGGYNGYSGNLVLHLAFTPSGVPPTITTQPANQTVPAGGSATFTIGATGTAPLSYYWKRGGAFIAGATGTSYTTNNVQLADSGSLFSCLVSNAYGTMLSSNAMLFVTTTETVMPLPPHQTTYSGSARGFWFTAPRSFVITGVEVPAEAGTGNQSIAVVRFNSDEPPTYPNTTNDFTVLFLTQNNPATGKIAANILVTQGEWIGVMGVRGDVNSYGVGPYTSDILGTPVTLTRMGMQYPLSSTAPQDLWQEPSGNISRVMVYVSSATPQPPFITSQPTNQAVAVGGTATFSVTSSGTAPLSYFWKRNGAFITGATASSYTTNNVQLADSGAQFSCLVSNACGTTNSLAATLTVTSPSPAGNVAYLRSTSGLPWGRSDNEGILTMVFGTNWQDFRYETVNTGGLFSADNKFIFMEGSDSSALEMGVFLTNNLPAISNWVNAGGSLFLNAAPNQGTNIYFGFGVTLTYSDFTDTGVAVNPAHAIFNGPYLPVGTSFSGNHFGHATASGAGLIGLLTNSANGHLVLAEQNYGSGHLLVGGMTLPSWHSPQPQATNLLANILAYGASVVPTNLITFDDLPATTNGIQVTNDYRGLSWSNFYALDALHYPNTSGYQVGMISASNVAYNANGSPAAISSASLFNLVSAYLTAAWNQNLQVQALGYNGPALLYSNTYVLSATNPTLINFYYRTCPQSGPFRGFCFSA